MPATLFPVLLQKAEYTPAQCIGVVATFEHGDEAVSGIFFGDPGQLPADPGIIVIGQHEL